MFCSPMAALIQAYMVFILSIVCNRFLPFMYTAAAFTLTFFPGSDLIIIFSLESNPMKEAQTLTEKEKTQ